MADDTRTRLDGVSLDGWQNAMTGIGDPARDKSMAGAFVLELLSGAAQEARWRGSDLGGRIVEIIPDEMMREGFEITIQPGDETDARSDFAPPDLTGALPVAPKAKPGPLPEQDDEGAELAEQMDKKLRDLRASQAIREALCYERAFGGGGILIGARDGLAGASYDRADDGAGGFKRLDAADPQNLTAPLDEERIESIGHLTAFRGGWDGELVAWDYYADPTEARYGEPRIYMLRNIGVPLRPMQAPGEARPPVVSRDISTVRYVHESRLLVFPGKAVSHWARVQMMGWGDSVFTRVDRVLSGYDQTWGSVVNLMTDFAQGVLKIKGLFEMLGRDGGVQPIPGNAPGTSGEGSVARRALMINMSRSIARTMVLDSEEDFTREAVSLAGVAEILQQSAIRVAACADIPVTRLMGQAPSGLNATGESDESGFYDRVAAEQRERLVPRLYRLIRLLFLAKDSPTGGAEPAKWSVDCRPLWQLTAKEEADLRKAQAETDKIYIDSGVTTPEEIAASRFGGSKYSTDTVLDLQGRQEMADLDAKKAATAAAAPPPPVVVAPAGPPDASEA